ncbi:putative fumarylacetoacetate hydrolase [Leptodontidium sp. 2 PMI_412]|nr:putative fumarylacetoacetate hydrolase [Leptodontidium sp. 2 PMI_412]
MGVKIDVPSGSPFTIGNIPFGVISTRANPSLRCATAIGNYAIDLTVYCKRGHLSELGLDISFDNIFSQPTLNKFAVLPHAVRQGVRKKIIQDLDDAKVEEECLVSLDLITMHLPMQTGGFSDFYCSLEHCINASTSTPLAYWRTTGTAIPKNWFYAPSVYNSRVSSVIPSPQPLRRPRGVYFKDGDVPTYGHSQQLDYELEMGYFVSQPVAYGSKLDIATADKHIFGFVLLNDWSARDLQMFEMKPLGPFHGKGFATSISTWVVTMDALSPFRCSPKTEQDPSPFAHLTWPRKEDGAIDVSLRVTLLRRGKSYVLGTSNLKYLYWTPFQQITHHASAGCGLETGDLLGTGTISGDAIDDQGNKKELGCLYEVTQAGTRFFTLEDGTQMKYLEDEDEIVLEGWCKDGNGQTALGFGNCRGKLLPALED